MRDHEKYYLPASSHFVSLGQQHCRGTRMSSWEHSHAKDESERLEKFSYILEDDEDEIGKP